MTKYSVEFKHDNYSTILSGYDWLEVMALLRNVSYLEIGMSIEVSSYKEIE